MKIVDKNSTCKVQGHTFTIIFSSHGIATKLCAAYGSVNSRWAGSLHFKS